MKFNNLRVPMKLFGVFAVMVVAIAAMGATVWINGKALDASMAAASQAAATSTAIEDARFALARQENSLRGYLLSADVYYLQRIDQKHRPRFLDRVKDLKALAADSPQDLARIGRLESAFDDWRRHVVDEAARLGADPATHAQGVAMIGRDGPADKWIEPVEARVDEIAAAAEARLKMEQAAQAAARLHMQMAVVVGLLFAIGAALGGGFLLTGTIAAPVMAMTGVMRRLAGGDLTIAVPAIGRSDEIGQMAAAVQTFKDAAIAKVRLEGEAEAARVEAERHRALAEQERQAYAAQQAAAVDALASGLERLASGDLTARIETAMEGRYAKLKDDFNQAVARLQEAMKTIVVATGGIDGGADEIAAASNDLSRRTEQQAASLEETAAALDQITATVRQTAAGAKQASEVVSGAQGEARASGIVVRDAVAAMGAIESSSNQIVQIIGVIDEIAFQTNLLALNAGVEAARAGDSGRGFAVVAQEVRALAQRSAAAAKEIKGLIHASVGQVVEGVNLVGQAGDALGRIASRVSEIDGLVGAIAASAQEQASGLHQVNIAINHMDQVVQQNAAMVEESTAASQSLKDETGELTRLVGRFQLSAASAAEHRLVA